MSDNVQSAMFEILKSVQASIAGFRERTGSRFDKIEETLAKQRRDTAALLVLMKGAVGAFEERLSKVESRGTRCSKATATPEFGHVSAAAIPW